MRNLTCCVFLLAVFAVSHTTTKAQGVYEAWVLNYDPGAGYQYGAPHMAVDKDGNVILAGPIDDSVTGFDWTLFKYSSSGNPIWSRYYSSSISSYLTPTEIQLDNEANPYIMCVNAITKYTTDGDSLWIRQFLGGAPTNILIDDSGYALSTGRIYNDTTRFDFITVKYSPAGDTVWARRYAATPGFADDIPTAIATDDSGYVYVTGYSDFPLEDYDYLTIKYSPDGNLLWARRYSGTGSDLDVPYDIAVDKYGGVYVSGLIYAWFSRQALAYCTIKYSSTGDSLWTRTMTGKDGAGYLDMHKSFLQFDDSGNLYVAGTIQPWGFDYTLMKLDPNGNTIWWQTYPDSGQGTSNLTAMTKDAAGNIILTGNTVRRDMIGFYDWLTVAYSPDGQYLWEMRYNGPGNDWDSPYEIQPDTVGNVYVLGLSQAGINNSTYKLIKYSPYPTNVKNREHNIPQEWSLSQNYPNPFNPSTNIAFTLPASGWVTLGVFNILGQKVKTLVNENLSPGYKQIVWDGTNQRGETIASGVYFYRLKTDGITESKKMVLTR